MRRVTSLVGDNTDHGLNSKFQPLIMLTIKWLILSLKKVRKTGEKELFLLSRDEWYACSLVPVT